MARFKNDMQLKSFLKKEADRLGISYTNCYNTFFSRELLRIIAENDRKRIIITKGSFSQLAHLGKMIRPVTDLDIASTKNIEIVRSFIDKVTENADTDIKFVLTDNDRVTRTGIHKISLSGKFGKINNQMGVDVDDCYNRLLDPKYETVPKIFEGDKEYTILTPSREEHLAEKLCIIAESNKKDILNTRVKDFYDIYQMHGGAYDPEKFTKYFKEMIKRRNKIVIDDLSTEHLSGKFVEAHKDLWDHEKRKYEFLDQEVNLDEAVYYTRAVLSEQIQKIKRKKHFWTVKNIYGFKSK